MQSVVFGVDYHTQRNNKQKPYISCYNTSIATVIDFLLHGDGFSKIDIGCPEEMQLDDYIYMMIYSRDTQKWLDENISRIGLWALKYKPHTLAAIECYIFNKYMNMFGYKAEFLQDQELLDYCKLIDSGIPQVLHGNFKPPTRIKGHIVVGIGYNLSENPTIICHDPFGDAMSNYENPRGADVVYPLTFFKQKRKNSMWITSIKRI